MDETIKQLRTWQWVAVGFCFLTIVGWLELIAIINAQVVTPMVAPYVARIVGIGLSCLLLPALAMPFIHTRRANALIAGMLVCAGLLLFGGHHDSIPVLASAPPVPATTQTSDASIWAADVHEFMTANCDFQLPANEALLTQMTKIVVNEIPNATNFMLLMRGSRMARSDPRFVTTNCQ